MSIGQQLPRFAVAGAAGFLVDAGVLYAALLFGLDRYSGRAASFFAAVVTTWLINRQWTFQAHRVKPTSAEFARYFGAMSLGGAVNYATYAIVVAALPWRTWLPLAAVAAGSVAGLAVNFAAARKWVFGSLVGGLGIQAAGPGKEEPDGVNSARESQRWRQAGFWAALALGVLVLKVVGLMLDPQPQFFMGDSASYAHTALTGWVPSDRSYFYGLLVGVIVADTQSLAPLVMAQAMASAATAVLAAWWAHLVFGPRRAVLCAVALLCALDPSQLLYERYVMTEAFSLLALAVMIVALTHVIVRGQWPWMLVAAVAGASVLALRMSLLPVVLACMAAAPLLALIARTLALRHALLGLGVAVMFAPLALSMASRIHSGPFLLAAWGPLLTPNDFRDPEQGARVLKGIELTSTELFAREINLWHHTGFMHRLNQEEPDPAARHRLARETALRVLRRDPVGVFRLGWRTYARLWDTDSRLRLMRWDVGQNPLGADFRETLARSFRLVADEVPGPTLTSRYYLSIGLWTAVAGLVAPLLLAAAMHGRAAKQAAALSLLVIASGLILLITGVMTTLPVVRYLHPLGWMIAAAFVAAVGDAMSSMLARRHNGLERREPSPGHRV